MLLVTHLLDGVILCCLKHDFQMISEKLEVVSPK